MILYHLMQSTVSHDLAVLPVAW